MALSEAAVFHPVLIAAFPHSWESKSYWITSNPQYTAVMEFPIMVICCEGCKIILSL